MKIIISAIKLFFVGKCESDFRALETNRKTHDYTKQFWGWALHFIVDIPKDGSNWPLMGHGEGINKGDFLLIKMKSGKTAKFRVEKIKYCIDPYDMWSGEIKPLYYI